LEKFPLKEEVLMTLPFTAWEQAAIVGIFAVFVIAMMGWVYKLVMDNQKHYDDQSDKWQGFIDSQNKGWQSWIEQQRVRDNAALCDVAESVKDMTIEIGKLSNQIERHDTSLEPRVEKIIERAEERANGTKKRARANSSV
jgi:hypothetical protein